MIKKGTLMTKYNPKVCNKKMPLSTKIAKAILFLILLFI